MAYFKGILVVALACLIHVHSVPMPVRPSNNFTLQFYTNTTTAMYNATDLSKPLALSNLQMALWSDKPPRLSTAIDATYSQIASLPTVCKVDIPHTPESNGEGTGFSLVYSYNQTEGITLGPRPSSNVYFALEFALWARK